MTPAGGPAGAALPVGAACLAVALQGAWVAAAAAECVAVADRMVPAATAMT